MIQMMDREVIADLWRAIMSARMKRGDSLGALRAANSVTIYANPVREAKGLREHNARALRRSGFGS